MNKKFDTFTAALEERGIDVDSTMDTGMNVSLMYEYDPDREMKDLSIIALLYAEVPQIATRVLSVTPIDTSGRDERVANYAIDRELAEQYGEGSMSKEEYIQAVHETWTPYGNGDSA